LVSPTFTGAPDCAVTVTGAAPSVKPDVGLVKYILAPGPKNALLGLPVPCPKPVLTGRETFPVNWAD